MRIVVFGAGLVGSAIIQDLAEDKKFQILAVDVDQTTLNKVTGLNDVQARQADLSEPDQISALVSGADLAINAMPGFIGYQTLESIINSGVNVVDISFFAEDPFKLDQLAKEKGITAVIDCGVAPGLCNILAGYVVTKLDQVDDYICYVGGLPQNPEWPYEYKAVFSPSDVIEEYVRPARFVENGKEVIYQALSGVELLDFPEIGRLEAFNTDGLRSLRHTLNIPNMGEKTLRYPGHANLMRIFRESGFFSRDRLEVDGVLVEPLALTSRLLFDQWKLTEGEEDLTIMQVVLAGKLTGDRVIYQYDLVDYFDQEKKVTSMARTTGYTCTIVARQLLAGRITTKGICPPEYLGKIDGFLDEMLVKYEERGIHLRESIK